MADDWTALSKIGVVAADALNRLQAPSAPAVRRLSELGAYIGGVGTGGGSTQPPQPAPQPVPTPSTWEKLVADPIAMAMVVGPRKPLSLHPGGDYEVKRDGEIIDGLRIEGLIRNPKGYRFTVVDSSFWAADVGADRGGYGTFSYFRSIPPAGVRAFEAAIAYAGYTASHGEIAKHWDGLKAHGNVKGEYLWIHDLDGSSGTGNGAGGYPHTDAVQISYGAGVAFSLCRMERSTGNGSFYVKPEGGSTVADIRVEKTYLQGGNYALFADTYSGGRIDRLTAADLLLDFWRPPTGPDWRGLYKGQSGARVATWTNVREVLPDGTYAPIAQQNRVIPYRNVLVD